MATHTSRTEHGQFYTVVNPFHHPATWHWFATMPDAVQKSRWLEPFAGANNIVEHLADAGVLPPDADRWSCFDIDPEAQGENTSGVNVKMRDTLLGFPQGHDVAVTNPPYLAKNSAARRKLPFPQTNYDDLYKHCLATMLQHCGWVGAIVPESFITSGLFHDRLVSVVSLNCSMFEDTEVPVCVAFFVPAHIKRDASPDIAIYPAGKAWSKSFKALCRLKPPEAQQDWVFNDPQGPIGLRAIDNTREASIAFVHGHELPSIVVSESSRAITRITPPPGVVVDDGFLRLANLVLARWRNETADVFLTAFKGLREDRRYRRRLDWAQAKAILERVYFHLTMRRAA